jgi:hypothetical protein
MKDDEFLRQFEAAVIPMEQWHHREHIKVAYLYLNRNPQIAAIEKIISGIKALNTAQNVPEAIDRGYHDTMTHAWIRLVQCTLDEFGPAENADAFMDKHTQLLSKRALLFFYSRDRIMSAEAKAKFIEPDLAPLPQSRRSAPQSP